MEGSAMANVVDRLVSALVERLRARDVNGATALFEDDAALYGSEAGESALGSENLRRFFERIFSRPHTYGWTWSEIAVAAEGEVIWFVAPATVVLRDEDGGERRAAYRLSGVLRRGAVGEWRFSLFNGSEPVGPPVDESATDPQAVHAARTTDRRRARPEHGS